MPKQRIILFSPLFYGYWKHIKRELETLGYDVSFITYRTNKMTDGIIDLCGETIKKKSYNRIVERRIQKLKGQFDYLIVIKGLYFSDENLDMIRRLNPNITTIMYQWDSLRNHNYIELAKNFDKVFTFDPLDAKEQGFNYLPLFYTNDILESKKKFEGKEDIDLLLIGIYNKSRYEYLQRLKRLAPKLKIYTHLVVPPGLYLRKELFSHKLGLKDRSDFKFTSISRDKLLQLYCRSKVFVDVCQNQSGMSMRTIEAYGMNKKLLTGNEKTIKEDNNLNDMMILSLDASDKEIIEFIQKKTSMYNQTDGLNIKTWCRHILNKF